MIPLLLSVLVATAAPAAPRVAAVEIVVRDLDAERTFFTQALAFRDLGGEAAEGGRVEHLALGNERVDLRHYDIDGVVISSRVRSTDRNFQHIAIIVSDMPAAWARVSRSGIRKVSQAPQTLPMSNPVAGGIAAVYFRDPEGHPLELLHFPAGKGAPEWHDTSRLFLGIDHTAIAVADTAASTRFYGALGLTVRGHSNNIGIEQERLSGIPGAHVQITGLRANAGPGVEFLHYVTPAIPQPPEAAAIVDLIATRTVVVEPAASTLCSKLPAVQSGPAGCVVRDPDGHLVDIRAH